MPRGRKPNLDKKIHDLVGQLKAALVARARQRIEAQVEARVAGLVEGLQRVVHGSGATPVEGEVAAPVAAARAGSKGNKRPRSAASRMAQSLKMKAHWKAKKAAEAKGKGGKAKAAATK